MKLRSSLHPFLLVCLLLVLPLLLGFAPKAQAEPPADPLLALLVLVYGLFVSWVAERFGAFQDLSPSQKQLTIALVGFVAPLIASLGVRLFGAWPESIGTPETFTTALLTFLAPVVIAAVSWLASQVGHYIDQALARLAGKRL